MRNLLLIVLFLIPTLASAQRNNGKGMIYLDENRRPVVRENIMIPAVNGFDVLKCDFHTHTVFSDGHVWPNVRNQEAWQEGLDALAITDHIEYTPHKEDVNVAHNRGYALLVESAKMSNILLVKGSEITRNTPPGHFNAIFTGDASGYTEDRSGEQDRSAVMKAAAQNAFIFWNHPGWQPGIEGSYEWIDLVEDLYKTNWHEIRNNSDLYFELELKEGNGTRHVVLYPRATQLISARAGTTSLTYDVTSTYVRSDTHLSVVLPLQ